MFPYTATLACVYKPPNRGHYLRARSSVNFGLALEADSYEVVLFKSESRSSMNTRNLCGGFACVMMVLLVASLTSVAQCKFKFCLSFFTEFVVDLYILYYPTLY